MSVWRVLRSRQAPQYLHDDADEHAQQYCCSTTAAVVAIFFDVLFHLFAAAVCVCGVVVERLYIFLLALK